MTDDRIDVDIANATLEEVVITKAIMEETVPTTKTNAANNSEQDSIIEQLSLQLLEQTEKNSQLEIKVLNSNKQINDLKRLLVESRKQKEESDKEVERLSYEMEDLSASLFDEANLKVKEANVSANDFKVRNDKLVETLKEKDMMIELLNNELSNLKDIIGKMEKEGGEISKTVSEEEQPNLLEWYFRSQHLEKFNNKTIYSPTFNQLRFDLHYFNQFKSTLSLPASHFNIRETTFYKNILTEEIEPVLRLDRAPSIKFYQKKSFIHNLIDSKVIIEPLSVSTEVWKTTQASQSAHSSAPSSPALSLSNEMKEKKDKLDFKLFKYETDQPVAVQSKCTLCGESRLEMNFARLYVLKLKEVEYLLCIACSVKLRRVVELLNSLKHLRPTKELEEIIKWWCEITELRVRLFYSKLGSWDDTDENGLAYGWKNCWIGDTQLASLTNSDPSASSIPPPTENADTQKEEDVDESAFVDVDTPSQKPGSDKDAAEEVSSPQIPAIAEKNSENVPKAEEEKHDLISEAIDAYTNGNTSEDDVFNDAEETHDERSES